MGKKFRVSSPREYKDRNGEKKTSWVPLGFAFENDRGVITVKLNGLPVGENPTLVLSEDDGSRRGGNRGSGGGYNNRSGGGGYENRSEGGQGYSDDVPF